MKIGEFKESLVGKRLLVYWIGNKDNGFYVELVKRDFLESLSKNGATNIDCTVTNTSVYVDGFE